MEKKKKVLKFSTPSSKKRLHPCEKPIPLLEHLLNMHSQTDDVVLDTFMGGGSTAVACLNMDRKFVGMELDHNYFEITEKRIKNLLDKE
jgi:site-specific DNA-methyltransferase (adenine-specific)